MLLNCETTFVVYLMQGFSDLNAVEPNIHQEAPFPIQRRRIYRRLWRCLIELKALEGRRIRSNDRLTL